jgi:Oxidoreductase family, NAD-binding Rossmann fold
MTDQPARRLGIIGPENSHVDHFIRFLNVEGRHPGNRVSTLVGEPGERIETLAAAGSIDDVVAGPEELLGRVDAAIVCSRDGRLHRAAAEPLLSAGIPVLVDKPLATTTEDAEALIKAAERGGVPLVSFSALRFAPEVGPLETTPRHLVITGPADPASEYAGLFFYGIHHVETAFELLGNPANVEPDVSVRQAGDTTVAAVALGDTSVTFAFVVPRDDRRVPFHLQVVTDDAVSAREITLGPDYNAPALARFIEACDSGTAPLGRQELLAPVAVLAAIEAALPG